MYANGPLYIVGGARYSCFSSLPDFDFSYNDYQLPPATEMYDGGIAITTALHWGQVIGMRTMWSIVCRHHSRATRLITRAPCRRHRRRPAAIVYTHRVAIESPSHRHCRLVARV